jgi:release factor glutamine methyltransferase
MRPTSEPLRIVDVGTGSGCVAISLARHLPDCQLYALDISPDALQLAAQNITDHQLENRIILREGDLLAALPSDLRAVDLIVSNPPYVSPAEYSQLPRDVRDFEPKVALVAGDEGMETSLRLLEQAEQSLRPDGAIMLESSPMLVPRLERWLQARAGWRLLPTVKVLHGHSRIVAAERPAANHS